MRPSHSGYKCNDILSSSGGMYEAEPMNTCKGFGSILMNSVKLMIHEESGSYLVVN